MTIEILMESWLLSSLFVEAKGLKMDAKTSCAFPKEAI